MMKKVLIFLALVMSWLSWSQSNLLQKDMCLTDQWIKLAIQKNPDVKKRIADLNSKVKLKSNSKLVNISITVPVVVIVVHENGSENIPDLQINSQLLALNNYFSSTGIKFCLAKLDGTNVPSTGIIRINSPLTNNSINTASNLESLTTVFPSNKYLKIWVVKDIQGTSSTTQIQGYATFPNTNGEFDGVVMKASAFGNASSCGGACNNLNPATQTGKVLVHEIGHYFGLYHTFEEGCGSGTQLTCNDKGDRVCDTPPVQQANFSCTNSIDTCPDYLNQPDDISNYMDYVSESCQTHFTEGQKQRMYSIIFSSRSELVSSTNLLSTGVTCISPIISYFNVSSYEVCSNNTSVNFIPDYNYDPNNLLTYNWDFGDSTSSTLQNPTHTYTTPSSTPYTVTLTVSDGVNSVTSSKKIYVKNCIPLNNLESVWRFGNNKELNFISSVPVLNAFSLPTNYSHQENCANQLAPNGQFLFHSNGKKIFDGNNIALSTNILGSYSARHGALSVPNPNVQNQYYLFIKRGLEQTPGGFMYTLINASNPNNVTVDPQNINVPVILTGYNNDSTYGVDGGEGITAIKSCDGYWIITTAIKNSRFYIVVYKLNNLGLTFISETPTLNYNNQWASKFTFIKASPNGNKIVLLNGWGNSSFPALLNIFDFNKFDGSISNFVNLNATNFNLNAACFSPDSNILYISDSNGVYQYNVNDVNPIQSMKKVTKSAVNDIQIGPDDKLYLKTFKSIYVIHKPNNLIVNSASNDCLFTEDGLWFGQFGDIYGVVFPNLINAMTETAYNNTISFTPKDCFTYNFFPNACGSNFTWNFGDPGSGSGNIVTGNNVSHTFSSVGTYTVTCMYNNSNIISTTVTVGMPSRTILGNTTACLNQNSMTNNYVNLLLGERVKWTVNGGAIIGLDTQSNVDVNWSSLPGILTATITNPLGCISTVNITVNNDNNNTVPTFNQVAPVCPNITPVLPTTSTNGITGTWALSSSTATSLVYTFTPASGQCSSTTLATMTVTILLATDPSCQNSCQPAYTLSTPEINSTKTYRALNLVESNTNYIVASGKQVTMKCENTISFKSGTYLNSGSTVWAKIQSCSDTSKTVANEVNSFPIKNNFNDIALNYIDSNDILLFPNPSSEIITIKSSMNTISQIDILSIDGKTVLSQKDIKMSQLQIDISKFQNGVYIVTFTKGDGSIIKKKIIKE